MKQVRTRPTRQLRHAPTSVVLGTGSSVSRADRGSTFENSHTTDSTVRPRLPRGVLHGIARRTIGVAFAESRSRSRVTRTEVLLAYGLYYQPAHMQPLVDVVESWEVIAHTPESHHRSLTADTDAV
jgi:hypothetical protein